MATILKEAQPKKLDASVIDKSARSIGTRLRQLRKSQRITLVELANTTGVDAATISRMENGKMTGTLECHIKLATALGVKVTELYLGIEEERTKDGVTFQSVSGRSDVYVHERGRSSITMLTTNILKKKLMPVLITIEPGGSTQQEEARVGTEKFIYALEGVIDATVGKATHAISKGSSLYLDASIPHRLKNAGKSTARCLCVVTPPVL